MLWSPQCAVYASTGTDRHGLSCHGRLQGFDEATNLLAKSQSELCTRMHSDAASVMLDTSKPRFLRRQVSERQSGQIYTTAATRAALSNEQRSSPGKSIVGESSPGFSSHACVGAFNFPGPALSPPRHRRDVSPRIRTDAPVPRPPQLMIKCLNNQFSRNTEEQFKKEHTGAGWQGAIELTENALAMQLRFGRL